MGLMKLAMYYRLQGDDVTFWKGDFTSFVVEELLKDLLRRLEESAKFFDQDEDTTFDLTRIRAETPAIRDYIRTGKIVSDSTLELLVETTPTLRRWLQDYRGRFKSKWYFKEPRWDLVGVTTLFTFYWDITIETIEFAKRICKDWKHNVHVGGVLASVVPDRVQKATGIKPHCGILNITHFRGDAVLPAPFTKTMIDALPLDYSILDETDYQYPETDAFYGYATRGCVNHCPFCVVPILEPKYRDFIPLKERIEYTTAEFGAQRNLLLLDNNVFASAQFDKIIDDIKSCGFGRNDKYMRPNQLKIAVRQLKKGWNDRAYLRRIVRLLEEYKDWSEQHESEVRFNRLFSLLSNNGLLHDYTATRSGVLAVYKEIKNDYAAWHKKRSRPITRIVDFNQGLDARLATPARMRKLSEISIRPLRIAFDNWALRSQYVRAIKLGADNGIVNLSNYLLYNFTDKPVDLYHRLSVNVQMCEDMDVSIYSFPMKYHPIRKGKCDDEDYSHNRDYIGKHWNRKYIRAVQAILNSTKGKIGKGMSFFLEAFGATEEEYFELLEMPETFILYRFFFKWLDEKGPMGTDHWRQCWCHCMGTLDEVEKQNVLDIIHRNIFSQEEIDSIVSEDALTLLNFYTNYRKDIITPGTKLYELKQEYDAHPTIELRRKKQEHE